MCKIQLFSLGGGGGGLNVQILFYLNFFSKQLFIWLISKKLVVQNMNI